jgi:hypothetical protein
MKHLAQSLAVATIAVFGCLSSISPALTSGYSVAYAIDAHDENDSGKIETCEYGAECKLANHLGLSIVLNIKNPKRLWADLEIKGPPGCCYSAQADETLYVEMTPTLMRVPFYEGQKRRRNEFVLNKKFGVLYLMFGNIRWP